MQALQGAIVNDPTGDHKIFVNGLRIAKRTRMKTKTKRKLLDISKAELRRVNHMQQEL